ncbi:MAG TPA: hypothetical protein VGE15_07100, partial [Sphingobacteriaceae bacterium]
QDVNGRPILETQYTHVEGSPYLFSDWTPGVVKLKNGTTYKEIPLKYDQVAEELLFSHNGQALTFVEPVVEFRFKDGALFRSGYGKGFYEVLSDGGTKLIRKKIKQISESKEYNSASVTRKFVELESLYIVKGSELTKIRKDKKSVLAALGDKTAQLESYIKSEKLNIKNEAGIVSLVAYYNSL